jgi:hypothetical protein
VRDTDSDHPADDRALAGGRRTGLGIRQLLLAGAFVLIVATAVVVWQVTRDGAPADSVSARIGPAGGAISLGDVDVRFAPGTFADTETVRVSRTQHPGRRGEQFAQSVSDMYDVTATAALHRPAELRFKLDETAPTGPLGVASRERHGGGWELVSGHRVGRTLVAPAAHFTLFRAVRLPLPSLSDVERSFQRAMGTRTQRPNCSPDQQGVHVEVEDDDSEDPLIYACAKPVGGGSNAIVLAVVNNRAIAMDFEVPDGMRIASANGRGLEEAFWDAINKDWPTGGRLLPGGGRIVLTGRAPKEPIVFKPTNQALVTELLLVAATRGRSKGAAAGRELNGATHCFWTASERPTRHLWATVRDVWSGCANVMPVRYAQSVGTVLGAAQLVQAILDQYDVLRLRTTKVSVDVPKPARLPPVRNLKLRGPISESGLAPVTVGMSVPAAESLTGLHLLPGNPAVGNCTYFEPSPGMGGATEADYLPGASFMVTFTEGTDARITGVIARVDVDKPGYRTERGVGVGDSERFALYRYPEARVSQHEYFQAGHYLTIGRGDRQIVIETDGHRVTAIRAGRRPEVEYVEHCL